MTRLYLIAIKETWKMKILKFHGFCLYNTNAWVLDCHVPCLLAYFIDYCKTQLPTVFNLDLDFGVIHDSVKRRLLILSHEECISISMYYSLSINLKMALGSYVLMFRSFLGYYRQMLIRKNQFYNYNLP